MTKVLIVPTLGIALVAMTGSAHAQAAPAGRAAAPAAPAAKSKPAPPRDITGTWMMRNPPGSNRGFTNFTYTDPKTDPPKLTAWGEAKFKEAKDSNGGTYTLDETNDPVLTRCYPPGVPRIYFHPYPFEVIQTPKETLLVYEYDHFMRRVKLNKPLPKDPDPLWMGTSVGRWEGSDFVVETAGFNDKTWLDRLGHAHTENLKVTERFHRVDFDHLELQITMDDPMALAKPWVATFYYELRPGWELGEISCSGDYLDWDLEKNNRKNK